MEAMGKVVQAWGSSGALYPDIAPALSKINNGGIKVSESVGHSVSYTQLNGWLSHCQAGTGVA